MAFSTDTVEDTTRTINLAEPNFRKIQQTRVSVTCALTHKAAACLLTRNVYLGGTAPLRL